MTVRAARFVDIPDIVSLMHEAHEVSIYAGRTTFDEIAGKHLCVRAIQRHGHRNLGGMLVMVAENNGRINGFMIGLLDSVYPCLEEMMATDLVFYFSKEATMADWSRIVRQIEIWAESSPKVIEVFLGITSAIGDWERTAKLYRRRGYEQCGAMFRRDVVHEQKEAMGQ